MIGNDELEVWKKTRKSVLDASEKRVFGPFRLLYDLYAAVCVVYIAGFIRLNISSPNVGSLNIFDVAQLLLVGSSMLLLLVLTPAVVMLIAIEYRNKRISNAIIKLQNTKKFCG